MEKTLKSYRERLEQEGLLVESSLGSREQLLVSGITYHSGKAVPGCLFVCKGAGFREEYLEEAMRRGAAAYVSLRPYPCAGELPCLIVNDMRRAQFVLGEAYYGNPAEELHVVGITGTKGKTTMTYYLKSILDAFFRSQEKKPCALLSSIEYFDGKEHVPSTLTTPEALELCRHMRNAVDAGMTHMVMEVSSQALKYQRIGNTRFDTAVFLNISEDHISPSEHQDFQDYFASKLKIFDRCRCACVNLDCDHAGEILEAASRCSRVVTFGMKPEALVRASDLTLEGGQFHFTVTTPDFQERFVLTGHGVFNVENALAAIAAAWSLGVPAKDMVRGLDGIHVPGRMETYQSEDGAVTAIVDYAHNGLSFRRIFEAVELEYPGSRITAIFGCPGGKAFNRRKDLGEIAGERASRVYLVPDDPGREDPAEISREISGYVEAKGCFCRIWENRGEAIREAVRNAEPGDVILVLGKGEESFIRYGEESRPYPSDGEYVKAALQEYGDVYAAAAAARMPEIEKA